jgi:hypothetical protein
VDRRVEPGTGACPCTGADARTSACSCRWSIAGARCRQLRAGPGLEQHDALHGWRARAAQRNDLCRHGQVVDGLQREQPAGMDAFAVVGDHGLLDRTRAGPRADTGARAGSGTHARPGTRAGSGSDAGSVARTRAGQLHGSGMERHDPLHGRREGAAQWGGLHGHGCVELDLEREQPARVDAQPLEQDRLLSESTRSRPA